MQALQCEFAQDYADLIKLSQKVGRPGKSPKIFLMIPPPLMQHGAIGMNQTVINSVFPSLVPKIALHNGLGKGSVIDIFSALGGSSNWQQDIPSNGCTLQTGGICKNFCCKSCDQCHPCKTGYHKMAETIARAITAQS